MSDLLSHGTEGDEAPEPQPWLLDWGPDDVARFWAWLGRQPVFEGHHFSAYCGDSLLRAISRLVPLNGIVVDLGAARSDMTRMLLERMVRVIAVDQSAESVAFIRKKFAGNPAFLGAHRATKTLPLGDASVDVVLVIETLEHLNDRLSTLLIGEIHRVLRPGGTVMATVPNSEDRQPRDLSALRLRVPYHPTPTKLHNAHHERHDGVCWLQDAIAPNGLLHTASRNSRVAGTGEATLGTDIE